jgi:uncharacterized protein (TIGR02145 family)
MKHLYLLGLFVSLPFLGFSQGEFNNWYFGMFKGMNFNVDPPVFLPGNPVYDAGVTINVSDSEGNLLFFSDGSSVHNRNKVIMPNGSGLWSGSGSFEQGVTVVQNPADDSTYFLFLATNYQISSYHPGSYSLVNMRLDGKLGDVELGFKNVPLPYGNKAYEAVTGTRHKNNRDAWIVYRLADTDSNYYASYLVTQAGIANTPILSLSQAYPLSSPFNFPSISEIKISQDGTKLVGLYNDTLEICDFDPGTGQVHSRFRIVPYFNGVKTGDMQAEFSIDSKLLYITGSGSGGSHVYQFDATSPDSLSYQNSILDVGLIGGHTALQMAPNWKIYGTEDAVPELWVINFPSVRGTGCNFSDTGFFLGNPSHADGLPQFIQRYKAYIHHNGQCQGVGVHFFGDIWPPADSTHWDFGDPGSGANNYSTLSTPSHVYSNVGTYTVTLFVRHNDNRTDTSWQTITIVASPQVALGADRTICIGDSTTFDAGACSGCTYQWKNLGTGLIVGTGQTYKTGLADSYSVIVTNSNNCTGSDTVLLFTTPVPSVANTPLSKSICSGDSTEIALTSNVPGATFHWTASLTSGNISGFSADSGLVINQVLVNSLSTPGIVTYHITPKVGSCAGTTVNFPVTVTPGDSVKVSITSSINNICAGTQVTFTATPINPGTTPIYQWKVSGINSGTNSTTFTYTPVNGDIVTCVLTSSITACISNNPATSNGITMVVNPNLPVSVSVGASQNPVCAGNSVTFTATPTNGGLTPLYQWKVNGVGAGTNSPIYSYIPNNADIVTCVLTSNAICPTGNPATSNAITMTVNPNLPVSITIAASANPFCLGSSVTYTGVPVNGGPTPSFQWQVNGINVGTNSPNYTYNPLNGDLVSCVLTSSVACPLGNPATSNTITMIVISNLPAGVTIAASSNPFCPGSSVTFTATPVNGGTTPSYQWKVNGVNAGTNSYTFTYNPADGDSVRCIITSNLSCVTGNPASSTDIIMSGTLAPIVTFTSCFDTITTINAKPIKLKGGIPLGGIYSGPGVNSLTGVFTPSLAGTGTKTITYSYTNVVLCTASKNIHIIVQAAPLFACGNNLTDIRDNKVYQTVQIGSQCWLASNLNYGTVLASSQDQRDNCISEKYCYNDNPVNCTNQGGLYQWDELMQYDDTPGDQGFCPPAWHIPSENDWNTLFATYINNGFAGSPLKYSGYSGFNALLSGVRHIDKSWDFQGFATFFWSSTLRGSSQAWAHGMNDPDPSVSVYPASRANAFSVRCLHD